MPTEEEFKLEELDEKTVSKRTKEDTNEWAEFFAYERKKQQGLFGAYIVSTLILFILVAIWVIYIK